MTANPIGVWLGVDVGAVRVGVARSDPAAVLATPLVTLARDTPEGRDLAELAALVAQHEAVGVIVGLPRTLAGQEGPSAELARAYARELTELIGPVRVILLDERYTTVMAQRKLSELGVRGRAQRAVVDQAAAVEILQQWLDQPVPLRKARTARRRKERQ